MTKRHILIVEDNRTLSRSYSRFAVQAARELSRQKLTQSDIEVHQAYSFAEAVTILQTVDVDFVSLDIALTDSEEGLSDMQRLVEEPGGMKVLSWMRDQKIFALTAVISGETLISYALDATTSRDLGVMGFLSKPMSRDKYQGLIQAVILYLEVAQDLQTPLEELQMRDLDAARQKWGAAVTALQRVGWPATQFPQDLAEQIQALHERKFVSLETGLPSEAWTEERLKSTIIDGEIHLGAAVGRDEWMLGYVWVEGYREFVHLHKTAEPYILQKVSESLQTLQAEHESSQIFVGHIGFAGEPTFAFFVENEALRADLNHGRELVASLQEKLNTLDVTLFRSQLESTAEKDEATVKPKVVVLSHEDEHLTDINMLYDLMGNV